MSSREIVVRINRKALTVVAALILIATLGRLLWSEALNLVTTYPAPAGIYNTLVTTGDSGSSPANTTLNRNAGHTILVPSNTNANGRVGIGTTSPAAKLDINGALRAESGFFPAAFNWEMTPPPASRPKPARSDGTARACSSAAAQLGNPWLLERRPRPRTARRPPAPGSPGLMFAIFPAPPAPPDGRRRRVILQPERAHAAVRAPILAGEAALAAQQVRTQDRTPRRKVAHTWGYIALVADPATVMPMVPEDAVLPLLKSAAARTCDQAAMKLALPCHLGSATAMGDRVDELEKRVKSIEDRPS